MRHTSNKDIFGSVQVQSVIRLRRCVERAYVVLPHCRLNKQVLLKPQPKMLFCASHLFVFPLAESPVECYGFYKAPLSLPGHSPHQLLVDHRLLLLHERKDLPLGSLHCNSALMEIEKGTTITGVLIPATRHGR